MHMRRLVLLSVVTLAVIALAGCVAAGTPGTGGTQAALPGTGWALTRLNGQPAMTDVNVTLVFEAQRLGGTDGCNQYGTAYEVKGNQLTISKEIAATLMACADEIMDQAAAYTKALPQTASYESDGTYLRLLGPDGKTLAEFTRLAGG